MFLPAKYKIKLRHPRSSFLNSVSDQEKNTIAQFKKSRMPYSSSAITPQYSIANSFKNFVANIFTDREQLHKKEQYLLIKELQLKTSEIEQLKRQVAEKEASLKRMSLHQSHTVRRPLANILGITKLIHAYTKEQPNTDLSQLIGFLQLSSDELDEAIKNNG